MASEKELFDCWTTELKDDLELRYASSGLLVDWGKLGGEHWGALWEIFRRGTSAEDADNEDYEAESVILSAHGYTHSEFEQDSLMDHYMTSSNYD